MRLPFLLLLLWVQIAAPTRAQMLTSPPAPNYNRALFHQSIGFHDTRRFVYIDDYNTVLDHELDLDFTIEFWVKIPASVPPGTMVLRTNNFDVNFASSTDENGNQKPSLLFLVKSYDANGHEFPNTDFYYHLTGQDLPYFNDWFHVAIVRNRQMNLPLDPVNPNTYPGTMRMYINGISHMLGTAPSGDLLPLDGGGISIADSYTPYLKLDELRIWKMARTSQEIYTYMNQPISRTAAGLMAYYNFDHANPANVHYESSYDRAIPNVSRGLGSPANDYNEYDDPLTGFIVGGGALGPPPVFGTDRHYESVNEGDWDDPNTWGGGEVPREDEIVTINQNVVLDQNRTQGGIVFAGPNASARVSAPGEQMIYTNGHTLRLLSPPSGGSVYSHVVTDSDGQLVVENIPASGATIPVGSETAYRPVRIAQPTGYYFFSATIKASDDLPASVSAQAAVVNALWDLQPVSTSTAPFEVTFQWNTTDERANFSRSEAVVANYHNETWNTLTSGEVGAAGAQAYSLSATATQFSPFIVTSDQSSLPIRLVQFDVTREAGMALLKWSAADADNFARFEIERSPDATTWTTVGYTEAPARHEAIRHYVYHDLLAGVWSDKIYYRIKMVDLDSRYSYSPTRLLVAEAVSSAGAYPNPAFSRAELNLGLTGDLRNAELAIFSADGREVHRQQGVVNHRILLPDLAAGLYILSVRADDGRQYREKIVIR